MPSRLYLRPQPRAFFLITEHHALVFRQPEAGESKAARSVVVAEFLPIDEVDTTGLVPAGRGRSVEGVLGVTSVPSERSSIPEVFLLLLTSSTPLPSLIPGSSLRPSRVVAVEFHSLTSSYWDPPPSSADSLRTGYDLGQMDDDDPYMGVVSAYPRAGQSVQPTQSQAQIEGTEDPCSGMRKYLESGGFFHAEGAKWDISRRLGSSGTNWVAAEHGKGNPLEVFDERFVWNSSLLAPLLAFRAGLAEKVRADLDEQAFLLPIIQGFVGSTPLSTGSWTGDTPDPGALALISRLSWKRAGARFRTRGIDDDGNVANFVETETILTAGETCLSYTQVRGSVPLFWQQPQQGLGTLQQKVEITRPPQATQPAFDKHFMDLLETYGAVHAINLLGQKDAEAMLSAAYADRFATLQRQVQQQENGRKSPDPDALVYTSYDFHAAVRLGGHEAVRNDLNSMPKISRSMDQFGIAAVEKVSGFAIEQQHGVFRVNCLDCLDRTNYVQEVLSTIALRRFLSNHGSVLLNSPTLWAAHRELWADNGDRLSKTYAGTGALNTSATRSGRKTFAGLISDATKSVGRAYINNFQDKGKQTAIDMLLGLMAGQRPVVLFDPVGDSVQSALHQRQEEYSSARKIIFFSGTWNVNGKAPKEALNPWLFPTGTQNADVYAIAFQEIVELTPQQIMVTDPAKKRVWEKVIVDTFASHCGKSEYILLRSEQLVGTALMILVKASLLPAIRNIEYAEKKTGLQGFSGNKGGVGVRFDLFDSTVCLMTCHLAAGQSNVLDRNADYDTISRGLKFLRGKTIDNHDIVIWAADFNYRVDLPNDVARSYAATDQLDLLFASDQLAEAMDEGKVFVGYAEGPLIFPPTYKYDNGTDVYDSSEKQRVPSWTDRVLYKGENLELLEYNCADLRTSDHRPVYALLQGTVFEVNEAKKAQVAEDLAAKARARTGGAKIDNVVEKASQGGVRSLVKELTAVSLPPSPVPSPKPRGPAPPISRDNKPRNLSLYEKLGVPPSLPPRNGSPTVTYEPRKRAPPPIPANDFRKIGLPPSNGDSSAEITPVATGDFVIVPSPNAKRPPPLPARQSSTSVNSVAQPVRQASTSSSTSTAPSLPPRLPSRPSKKGTLDMDAPPPEGLVAPVVPDNRRKAPAIPPKKADKGESVREAQEETNPSPETSKPVIPAKPAVLRADSADKTALSTSPTKPSLAPKPSQLKGNSL